MTTAALACIMPGASSLATRVRCKACFLQRSHKENNCALRKKTQAPEDSNAQAEEEEEKESAQDPQVIVRYRTGTAAAIRLRPFFIALCGLLAVQ